MRLFKMGFVLLLGVALIFSACTGSDQTADAGSSGGGGSGGGGSGGVAGAGCSEITLTHNPCNQCLQANCCAESVACDASTECSYCIYHPDAYFCEEDPQRSLAAATHECGRAKCTEECKYNSLGPGPGTSVDHFCRSVGPPLCEALFACCTDPKILSANGGSVSECKAEMARWDCIDNTDASYNGINGADSGLRGWIEAGQVIFDQAQLDMCVAELKAMAAGGAACTTPPDSFFDVSCLSAFKGQFALGDTCPWYSPLGFYAFLPCREGRCEGGTCGDPSKDCTPGRCVPFLEAGDACDPKKSKFQAAAGELCNYLRNEDCIKNSDTMLYSCRPRGELGDACTPGHYEDCKSAYCDATGKCARSDPQTSACWQL